MNVKQFTKLLTKENPKLAKSVNIYLNNTKIIRYLIETRVRLGLSQSEIAKRMKCSKNKVFNLEHSFDGDLKIKDLINYSYALGYKVKIELKEDK